MLPMLNPQQYHTIQLFSTSKSLICFILRLGEFGAWWPERQIQINITYLHCYQLYSLILPPSSPESFYHCLILYCGFSTRPPKQHIHQWPWSCEWGQHGDSDMQHKRQSSCGHLHLVQSGWGWADSSGLKKEAFNNRFRSRQQILLPSQ